MIPNIDRKTMDMEARDTNYFLQAYLISYLLVSKNEDPVKVIVPKFPSFPHPRKPGVMIPIEWVDPDSPIAAEIIDDGKNVPETPVEADARIEELSENIQQLEDERADAQLEIDTEAKSPAKAAINKLKERKPKMPPGGDLGAGHADGLSSRNIRADRRIATDLKPEASVDESKELETEIEKPSE